MSEKPLSPRLRYLLDHKAPLLVERIWNQDFMEFSPRQVLDIFAEADPSRNKSATQWLMNTYLNGGFRIEDILTENNKVFETLAMFGLHRRKLPMELRDLNIYKDLGSVWGAVKDFINIENNTVTGKAQKRVNREQAYQESIVIHEDETGFKVVVPMTKFSAQWWGRGTRWCTASEHNNMFEIYHSTNPLIVILLPNGDKYQTTPSRVGFQFMDAQDSELSFEDMEKNWKYFKPVIMWMTNFTNVTHYIPRWEFTKELCEHLIEGYPYSIRNIPREFLTNDIIMLALDAEANCLDSLPRELITRDIVKYAVQKNEYALEHVPEDLKTLELCMLAYRHSKIALRYFPEDFMTEELILEAVKEDYYVMLRIPYQKQTVKICHLAISSDARAIQYCNPVFLDRELCIKAVIQKASVIGYTPYLDRENIADMLPLIKQNPELLRYVDIKSRYVSVEDRSLIDEHLDKDFFLSTVKQKPNLFVCFPEAMRTYEVLLEAVKANGLYLESVPPEKRDYEICLEAVKKTGMMLKNVPEELKTLELCREAVKENYDRAIEFVPVAFTEILINENAIIPFQKIVTNWDIGMLDSLKESFAELEVKLAL